MTVTDHPAVGAYLARFDALAARLPQYRPRNCAPISSNISRPRSPTAPTTPRCTPLFAISETFCSTVTGPGGTTSDCPAATNSSFPLEFVLFAAQGLLLAVPFVVGLVLLRRARLRVAAGGPVPIRRSAR